MSLTFQRYDVDIDKIQPEDCEELASIKRGDIELSIVIVKDEDGEISYEYHLFNRQHAVCHWRAPHVIQLSDDKLFKLMYNILEETEAGEHD